MKDFKDKVAVITGAASGIGFGLAKLCVKRGIKTVIADVEEKALIKAQKELESLGGEPHVLSVITDVSKHGDVKNLADITIKTYGEVHLLFNNAGVGSNPLITRTTMMDYKFVLGVNLWGVIHGIDVFLPILQKQDKNCHIVNTTSGYGILPGNAAYGISKFGVTALSEMLAQELNYFNSKVKVSLLVPGVVNTAIIDSQRNRPKEMMNPEIAMDPEIMKIWEKRGEEIRQSFKNGMSPEIVAEIVFNAIEEQIFYVFCDLSMEVGAKFRLDVMLEGFKSLKDFIKKNKYSEKDFTGTESVNII
jgi:NAD(P)-dependent dehydrogenase (short-subunit alcohol dehydrogenase family)